MTNFSALKRNSKSVIHAKSAIYSKNAVEPVSGITELILASDSLEQLSLLMPMLAFLPRSCNNRWVSWVSEFQISREFLESFGVDTQYLRMIYSRDAESTKWIAWEALAQGNSHTVIASLGRLTEKEVKQFESAAHQGQCQGLLLRLR